jgi:hypothetical protein
LLRFREALCLGAVCAALLAVLIAFGLTGYWDGDESYHLIAARMVNAGNRPYVDFFYQQTPLFPYVTAAWMRVFGEGWRSGHLLSALCMGVAVVLTAGYVFSRLPDPRWRLAAAAVAALLVGLRHVVYSLGCTTQPYGLCLCFTVAAFRLVVGAVDSPRALRAAAAGLCAGVAAASTLLSAPAGPILFAWMLWHNRAGQRWTKALAFLAAGAVPFLPLAWLAWQGPRQVFFDVFEFHLFYRDLNHHFGLEHDLDAVTDWFGGDQGVVMSLLLVVGLLFLAGSCDWEKRRRAELGLCAWLVVGLGTYLSFTRPTFSQYFFVLTPFMAILAAVGLYAIGSRIWAPQRPFWLVLLLAGYYASTPIQEAGDYLEDERTPWEEVEIVSRQAERVTPAGGRIFCRDEQFYVPLGRLPPPGLENLFTHYLDLPPELSATLHIIPPAELDRRLQTGYYATLVIEAHHPWVKRLGLLRRYGRRKKLFGNYVFWQFTGRKAGGRGRQPGS